MRLLCARACACACALALLARAAAQITTASKGVGSGVCFVGPYGWTCDPDDWAFASTLGQVTAAPASSSSSTAALVANAPACSANCTDDCTPPCPPACAALKFEKRLALLSADTLQYFVNAYDGNDGAAGTRDDPWATLHRASAQLRWLRAVNPVQLSGGGMHVWVKSEPDMEVYSELSFRS